jgi:tRNA(Ile)-lysidine synthase
MLTFHTGGNMFAMEPVIAALRRAAESDLMPRGSAILLAVSGGADSMALFYGCLDALRQTEWRLSVGHVHHGLRGREADRDLAFVSEHARRAGLPFLFRRRGAAQEARALGLSPEAAARRVRYEGLQDMARQAGAERIAVAHQKEDVAETLVLARRRRGGVAALGGPRERRADGVVRPLLGVTREEILCFLAARGIGYRRDASNGNLRLDRNRVRRELAQREKTSGSAVETLFAEASAHAAERERLERDFEDRVAPRLLRGPGVTVTDAGWLAACPRALARMALARAAAPFAAPGRPPFTGREREQILERLAAGADFRFEAGRRIRFERRGGLLRVAKRPNRLPADALRV